MIPERTDYNGWTNYETWNVALWICNDQKIYNFVSWCVEQDHRYNNTVSYDNLIASIEANFGQMTGDGVRWMDGRINSKELDEMLDDL